MFRRETMKIISHKQDRRVGAGKIVQGLLLGSILGATVGWLTAPASGGEMLRRLKGDMMSAREKVKTAEGNIESEARALAQEVSDTVGTGESPATGRKHTVPAGS
jgi:gas vesicle protein